LGDALLEAMIQETAELDGDICHLQPFRPTLLEEAFPFRALSLVIAADRRSVDPVYSVHKWWARRPPALMRAVLLATFLSPSVTEREFWETYGASDHPLAGLRVLDPFMGGGSTLVEAARLGASTFGGDIDPLAVRVVRYELAPASHEEIRKAGSKLLNYLTDKLGDLYPKAQDAEPLHYFYIAEVSCPLCGIVVPLYRNLVLVRDLGRDGAVVREHPITVFCPSNYCLHNLDDLSQAEFECCGGSHEIYQGTFVGRRFHCPNCNTASTHRDLLTGVMPRILLAVEETMRGQPRRVRSPSTTDFAALDRAEHEWFQSKESLPHPKIDIQSCRRDQRPLSYGITRFEQLFTPRQLLVFGNSLQWLQGESHHKGVDLALGLAVSNALTTNNRLCGYATDYGRLSALFTIRGYSLPALPVELNPLHISAGRGTLTACTNRVAGADTKSVRRYVWSVDLGRPVSTSIEFTTACEFAVEMRAADVMPPEDLLNSIDACIFDPPYFDYISYDELSEFHRAWMEEASLAGEPLLPQVLDPVRSFGLKLARCLEMMLLQVRPGRLIAFTYHSAKREAWNAVGVALDKARLSITAVWPIRSDGHMGHHSNDGNCEWDILIVTRRAHETLSSPLCATVKSWIEQLEPLGVSDVDHLNMELALEMASSRFSVVSRRNG
jgi:putative DNA methylase